MYITAFVACTQVHASASMIIIKDSVLSIGGTVKIILTILVVVGFSISYIRSLLMAIIIQNTHNILIIVTHAPILELSVKSSIILL